MSDITSQSLTSLVNNIKEKKLSSEEVTKAFVDRSEKSKELNSYITEDFVNAIDKSKKFDEKPNLDLKLPGIPAVVLISLVQKRSLTAIGIPGSFKFRLGFSSNFFDLSIALAKSSVM